MKPRPVSNNENNKAVLTQNRGAKVPLLSVPGTSHILCARGINLGDYAVTSRILSSGGFFGTHTQAQGMGLERRSEALVLSAGP